MALNTITQALGIDIAHQGDFLRTSSGDLQTVAGLANLKLALYHRLVTVPGTLVYRPTYGVGIGKYQNAPNSFSIQQEISSLIMDQFSQEPRVASVNSVNISYDQETATITTIAVSITPVGYTEQTMNFTPFSGTQI